MTKISTHSESSVVVNGVAQNSGPARPGVKSKGVIGELHFGTAAKVPVMKGKLKVDERDGWVFSKDGFPAYLDNEPVSISTKDGNFVGVGGEVVLYPVGQARYIGLDGSPKTVRRYTSHLETALAFYRKHERPPSCDAILTDFTKDMDSPSSK